MPRSFFIIALLASFGAFPAFAQQVPNAIGAGSEAGATDTAPAGNVSAKTGTNARTATGIEATTKDQKSNRVKTSKAMKKNYIEDAPCPTGSVSCITPGQRDPDTAASGTPSRPTPPSADTKTEPNDKSNANTNNNADKATGSTNN